jgi:predicted nuclease of predicted toxin-antitoxin system
VTKDSDFNELMVANGFPPKVIWIRLGNCTTNQVEQLLRQQYTLIEAFIQDPSAGLLELR